MSTTLTVGAICDRYPATICATGSLGQAAQLLANSPADAIVAIASAVTRPTVIGMITYRELMNALVLGNGLDGMHVIDVLNRNPLVLQEDETIDVAIVKLRCCGAKHAPVTGPGGTLRGAISMDRLLGFQSASEQAAMVRSACK